MCNITYLPAGIEVPEQEIENAATWNNDGHGWAVAADVNVMLTGRYMNIDTALTTFKATREAFPNRPAMFHSRLATHGTVTLDNVHPFTVGKFAAVAHNGILPTKFQPTKEGPLSAMSDTAIMARYWLAGRAQTAGIWTRKERRRIARIIGNGNKLCILSVSPYLPEPRGYLVNGAAGTWDKQTGAWFSSDSYIYKWTPKKYTSGSGWLWAGDGYEWNGNEWIGKNDEDKKCPRCHTGEHVDITSGVCLYCDFCLDCLFDLRDCMCYYGRDAVRDGDSHNWRECDQTHCAKCSAAVLASDDAIEIRMTELGGES